MFGREKKIVFREDGSWDAKVVTLSASLLDVGVRYMKELKSKALKVSRALQKAGVPHAVIGGLAVAAHVARVDSTAERNTQDLDILLRRADLEFAKRVLEPLGYRYRKVMKLYAFMPKSGKPKFVEGVHVIWSGEKVRPDYLHAAPVISEASSFHNSNGVLYLDLVDLLVMKLTSYRHKDITHVQDLLDQKLITKKVENALPVDLQVRLRQIREDTKRERAGISAH